MITKPEDGKEKNATGWLVRLGVKAPQVDDIVSDRIQVAEMALKLASQWKWNERQVNAAALVEAARLLDVKEGQR